MYVLKKLIISLFAINAVFWGLFPHTIHCGLIEKLDMPCVSHNIHLVFGIVCYLVAFIVAQKDHLMHTMKS